MTTVAPSSYSKGPAPPRGSRPELSRQAGAGRAVDGTHPMGVPRAGTKGLNLISRRDANPLDAESGCGQRAGPIKMGTERRVVDSSGKASMSGWQGIRPGAKYQGERGRCFCYWPILNAAARQQTEPAHRGRRKIATQQGFRSVASFCVAIRERLAWRDAVRRPQPNQTSNKVRAATTSRQSGLRRLGARRSVAALPDRRHRR
jgi:hypothetical protein